MQYCKSLQVKSGMTATEFAAECGFSRNYWFVRARFDAPLTISDCERIANVCGMTLKELFTRALGSDAAIEAADIVLMDDAPSKLALAVRLSRRTMKIVWQNVIFQQGSERTPRSRDA